MDDITLLREYVERDSEEAFATLVTWHVNKVYSVGLRHTSNPHHRQSKMSLNIWGMPVKVSYTTYALTAGSSNYVSASGTRPPHDKYSRQQSGLAPFTFCCKKGLFLSDFTAER